MGTWKILVAFRSLYKYILYSFSQQREAIIQKLQVSILNKNRNINSYFMKPKIYFALLFSFLYMSGNTLWAQSLSLNHSLLNEYYRRQQLLGNVESTLSFTTRPLYSNVLQPDNIFDPEMDLGTEQTSDFDGIFNFHKNRGKFQLLPINLLTQYNSHHPEGYNDGLMIPARGFQTRFDAGFYFRYSILSIQFNPEFVYAQNKDFEGYPSGYTSSLGIKFPVMDPEKGRIDQPERFGDDPYNQFGWGQSSIRLNYKTISLGLSNENIWWGPGLKNALMMSNTAPGFLHLSFNTIKPIKTPIGFFEWQIISGKTEGSGYRKDLTDDWRYLNAMTFSYNPRWVNGLFLGFTRSFMVYNKDMGSGFEDYLPIFSFLTKASNGTNEEVDAKKRNQLISLFMRWLFPETHGEIYFEYGREDHSWDMRDLLMEPEHSNAYLMGFQKLFSLSNNTDSYIQIMGELTKLDANLTTIIREKPQYFLTTTPHYWYGHHLVKHGYTHKGQILGAGIGTKGSVQTLQVSWNRGIKQIGVELERYVHNNSFWQGNIRDIRSNWVDKSMTLFANWNYKHFLFYGKMKFITCYNYQWLYEPEEVPADASEQFWLPDDNTFNFHTQIGVSYRF